MFNREPIRTLLGSVAFSCTPAAVVSQAPPAPAVSVTQRVAAQPSRSLDWVTASGVLHVRVLQPGVARVLLTRAADTRVPQSFAVTADRQTTSAPYQVEEHEGIVVVRTAELSVRIVKQPLSVALLDPQGTVLSEQSAPVLWSDPGWSAAWRLHADEQVYGLGDKVRGFDRRGQAFELWNSDAYGWKPDADPLYKALPFVVFLNHGQAHGLFVDTPARARVDVGKTADNVFRFTAEAGGSLDYYLFAGPDPKQVVSAYTALTGRMPLPPRWALGYHQSRYSYMTERDARAVATRLRADKIPSDVLWLDIDYQQGNAPFTVDKKAFPNFTGMISDLAKTGMRTVVITDPHPKSYQGTPLPSGYAPYDSGAAGDHFIHDVHGGFYQDKVWPGLSVFPEFTLARTRLWWGGLYADFVKQGVGGFWNDMNEPALFNEEKTLPVFIRHRLDDGSTLDHTYVHNAYGELNARATYDGLRRLRPELRPFVLTRAAYAGSQRYAATWTGDNSANREHLALSIGQLANLGVSGYAFSGADVGGFVGCPDPELLAEWTELGALTPFFRNHSAKDACRREPWLHGPANEARIRAAIERRYRLLPYLYTVFEESARTGIPILRPLWLEYPNDPVTQRNASSFLLGADLLVAPKLASGHVGYDVQLPRAPWYDTVSEQLLPDGGSVHVPASNDSVRLFARAGAIIARQAVVQHTGQTPKGPLELEVWPASTCSGSLYLDDGETFGFETGAYRRLEFTGQADAAGISLWARSSGSFATWWQETQLTIHAVPAAPRSVTDSEGEPLDHEYDAERKILKVHVRSASAVWSVQLKY
ncbi:MAG: glycoside hydrolase family 31 protein [Myxococcales bacterium]